MSRMSLLHSVACYGSIVTSLAYNKLLSFFSNVAAHTCLVEAASLILFYTEGQRIRTLCKDPAGGQCGMLFLQVFKVGERIAQCMAK